MQGCRGRGEQSRAEHPEHPPEQSTPPREGGREGGREGAEASKRPVPIKEFIFGGGGPQYFQGYGAMVSSEATLKLPKVQMQFIRPRLP